MLKNRILSSVGGEEKLYSNDVFTSYVRTGTGADAVINTGIDMTKGYMLWSKSRSAATDHAVYDSARGVTLDLVTNSTAAQTTQSTGLKAVSSTGHTVGSLAKMNTSGATYVDWVWKKAPKFFDVVTYTGNGVAGRQIAHGLGITPGMVIIKRTDSAGDWPVAFRNTQSTLLNTTAAANDATTYAGGVPGLGSTTWFGVYDVVGNMSNVNASGATYVAYLFAHDPSADGIIQCGSFTTDGSGNATVNLGWEPQFLITKAASTTNGWWMQDSMRGLTANNVLLNTQLLQSNLSNAEQAATGPYVFATGFYGKNLVASHTYIYLAIRRPNKPPTTGTQVYNAIARTGTGAAATVTGVGFAPDLVMSKIRNASSVGTGLFDKLRGPKQLLFSHLAITEYSTTDTVLSLDMDGVSLGVDGSQAVINSSGGYNYINHFFRRAPGFFSQICYTGTISNKTEVHDLTKAPNLMLVKSRSSANDWNVWCDGLLGTEKLVLNSTAAKVTDATAWNSTVPTSSVISLGTAAGTNTNAATYVAYLFSNLAGIQSIGTYTGDGTSGRLINCGFTTGSRYVCIKAISTTGGWLVADSTRGITSGNDPYLFLNSTAAEVTTEDWLDPHLSGFLVNQTPASNANVNGVTYMYWSIA